VIELQHVLGLSRLWRGGLRDQQQQQMF